MRKSFLKMVLHIVSITLLSHFLVSQNIKADPGIFIKYVTANVNGEITSSLFPNEGDKMAFLKIPFFLDQNHPEVIELKIHIGHTDGEDLPDHLYLMTDMNELANQVLHAYEIITDRNSSEIAVRHAYQRLKKIIAGQESQVNKIIVSEKRSILTAHKRTGEEEYVYTFQLHPQSFGLAEVFVLREETGIPVHLHQDETKIGSFTVDFFNAGMYQGIGQISNTIENAIPVNNREEATLIKHYNTERLDRLYYSHAHSPGDIFDVDPREIAFEDIFTFEPLKDKEGHFLRLPDFHESAMLDIGLTTKYQIDNIWLIGTLESVNDTFYLDPFKRHIILNFTDRNGKKHSIQYAPKATRSEDSHERDIEFNANWLPYNVTSFSPDPEQGGEESLKKAMQLYKKFGVRVVFDSCQLNLTSHTGGLTIEGPPELIKAIEIALDEEGYTRLPHNQSPFSALLGQEVHDENYFAKI